MKPKATAKKRKVAKAPKTQQQTQRQSVIVNIGQPTRRRRVPREPKQKEAAGQGGQIRTQYPAPVQTYFIDRSPSQIILPNPFSTGVIQKAREEKVDRQTTSVSTNNEAAARLPGIEETLIRGQEAGAQTYATVLSRNPVGAPRGQFAPQIGRTLAPSTLASIEATYGQFDPFAVKK